MKFLRTIAVAALALLLAGCAGNEGVKSPVTNVIHPEWTADAVIYEVNVRQYSQEGTLKAVEEHLPRLGSGNWEWTYSGSCPYIR